MQSKDVLMHVMDSQVPILSGEEAQCHIAMVCHFQDRLYWFTWEWKGGESIRQV